MSFDDAVAFWDTVGETLPISELDVGDVFLIEDHRAEPHTQRLVRLIGKWLTPTGNTQVQIEDVAEGDPKFVLVAR